MQTASRLASLVAPVPQTVATGLLAAVQANAKGPRNTAANWPTAPFCHTVIVCHALLLAATASLMALLAVLTVPVTGEPRR